MNGIDELIYAAKDKCVSACRLHLDDPDEDHKVKPFIHTMKLFFILINVAGVLTSSDFSTCPYTLDVMSEIPILHSG